MKVETIGSLWPDPAVKGVERYLAPGGERRFVKELARIIPIDGDVGITVVKQRIGQRAVLKVESASAAGPRVWFAKLFRRAAAADASTEDRMRALAEAARGLHVDLPFPVGRIPRFRAIVFDRLRGSSLADSGHEFDPVSGFRAAGEAIARLHAGLRLAAPARDRAFEEERIARARERLVLHRPDRVDRFDRVRNILFGAETAVLPPPRRPQAMIHGDFYPSQTLGDLGPDRRLRVAILDWDNASLGEAERDVGNFEAHVLLDQALDRCDGQETDRRIAAFRRGYEDRFDRDARISRWYRLASLLRLAALYADPSFGPDPPNRPQMVDRLLSECVEGGKI